MSFEINPVLAGKFDAPGYTAVNDPASVATANNGTQVTTNAASATDNASGPDSRRYTQFDRSIIDGAGSTTDFSFSDFVDMINPLEHIPIVSSVYRAITGETINPVSRVAGDVLYGGLMGIGSAVLGGMGAVADTELAAQTGKDSGGIVMAALFGPDEKDAPVQLADAGTAASVPATSAATNPPPAKQNIEIAQAATASPAQAALEIQSNAPTPNSAIGNVPPLNIHTSDVPSPLPAAVTPVAETAASPAAASASAAALPTADVPATDVTPSGTISLLASANGSISAKQPFGGIMAPAHPVNMQAQDMAVALAQGAPSMKLGHTIYTNRLMTGRHAPPTGSVTPAPAYAPPPVLPASLTTSSAANPALATSLASTTPYAAFASKGGMTSAPLNQTTPALMQDMMLKAISQYRNVAAGPPNTGGMVNLTN